MEAEVYDGHVHVVMTIEDARAVQNGFWRLPFAPARVMHTVIAHALHDAEHEAQQENEWTDYWADD